MPIEPVDPRVEYVVEVEVTDLQRDRVVAIAEVFRTDDPVIAKDYADSFNDSEEVSGVVGDWLDAARKLFPGPCMLVSKAFVHSKELS